MNAQWYARLRVIVGLALVFFGAIKFVVPSVQAENFALLPDYFRPAIAVLEIAGGVALVSGWQQRWAALGLAAILLGAVVSHFVVGVSPTVVPAILLFALNLLLAWRPTGTFARGGT